MFPSAQLQQIVYATNSTSGMRHSNPKISAAELKKYVGIRLAMALEGEDGSVKSFWDNHCSGFLLPRDDLSRTGMTPARFS